MLHLLKQTSRSFYLTLRILPRGIRHPIGLAYLLARTSDTIVDTEIVPPGDRLQMLDQLRQRILGASDEALKLRDFSGRQSSMPEQQLLEHGEENLDRLNRLPSADRERVRTVLSIIISGQELDLTRFAGAGPKRIVALETGEELDDYTYRVAGCVGEFWTGMCRVHLFPDAKLDEVLLLRNGVRFGKGLQLVNILRDLPADLRQGRCYLPSAELARQGLAPADLLDPAKQDRVRPAYDVWLGRAREHLRAGWDYTCLLPARQVRVRLACAWPILIGVRTLQLLKAANVLCPERPVKIRRAEVRKLMWLSVARYPFRKRWRRLLEDVSY